MEELPRRRCRAPPRPLIRRVVESFEAEAALDKAPAPRALHAIDLGCGTGAETHHLLETGWSVLAIDQEETAITLTRDGTHPDFAPKLETVCADFSSLALPTADLILALYSLPFCPPKEFGELWQKIVDAIPPGGRFAGQFFGVNDSWAAQTDMTFHTASEVERLLESFDRVEVNREVEFEGEAHSGPKHWHVFHIIAKRDLA